jgi:predicted phage terminase large subunit-like protein
VIIIDDPHNADEILSDVKRQAAIEWHDGTISTRFNQPETGVEVIIMQRLHERDIVGHVLDLDGVDEWEVLCLPEAYESKHPFVWPDDPRVEEGELLWPGRIGPAAHAQRKRRLGSYRAAGQLQQRPTAAEGAILKRIFWRYFDPRLLDDDQLQHLPKFTGIGLSWDTAFKDKTTSDYVAGGVWGLTGADRYLLRLTNERLSLAQTKTAIKEHRQWALDRWPELPITTVIEKSANGVEIIDQLKREIPGVKDWTASTDKVTRAWAAQPDLEAGNVFLPGYPSPEGSGYDESRTPAGTQELVEQAARFPFGEHDDMVDMVTQLVNWARASGPQAATYWTPDGRL